MRVRVVATYVTVAVVNATAGWLHLAAGESALGWAFILATLAFLLLGWEADGRLAHVRPDLPAEPAEKPSLALFELPTRTAPAPARARARRGGIARRVAWTAGLALVCGMELRLLAGLDVLAALAVSGAVLAIGLALPALRRLLPLAQRRTP